MQNSRLVATLGALNTSVFRNQRRASLFDLRRNKMKGYTLKLISIEEAARILYDNEYSYQKIVSWKNFPKIYRKPYFRSAKALIQEIQKRMESK